MFVSMFPSLRRRHNSVRKPAEVRSDDCVLLNGRKNKQTTNNPNQSPVNSAPALSGWSWRMTARKHYAPSLPDRWNRQDVSLMILDGTWGSQITSGVCVGRGYTAPTFEWLRSKTSFYIMSLLLLASLLPPPPPPPP